MEKNPVSFLQEYTMQRLKITPEYTVISQNVGTHINSFNIRVSCNGFTAEGVGSSKKEAKLNAAMKMINLLQIKQPRSSFSSPIINRCSSSISYNNNNNNSSYNSPVKSLSSSGSSPAKSPSSPSINYIGKLQEYVAQQPGTPLPEYECEGVHGPPHSPEFTMVCKYQGHSIKASANSKKEAKMLVAQKMFKKVSTELQIVVPEVQVQSYIESVNEGMKQIKIFENNEKLMKQSVEKALQNYSKLTNTVVSTSSASDTSFGNYHMLLKNKFSSRDRELIIDKLHDTMEACKSCLSLGNRITNPMVLLKTSLKCIDVDVKGEEYKTKNNYVIYSLKLETQPVINEIGYGNNRKEAEIMAIFLIAKTLTIMLL